MQGLEPWASCSQSRRATNCATPRYEVRRSGWAYSPKASALPTALHPDIFSFVLVLPVARLLCSPGLRFPKKSSRYPPARFFRPRRVLRLAASATGGARLRTPKCRRYQLRSPPEIILFFARLLCSPGLRSTITPTVYWIFRRKSTAGAPFLPAAKSKGRDLLRSLSLREMFCGFTGGNYLASTSAMWPMRSSSLLL